ncbi:hypothetical protein BCV73_01920 [Paenibacillus sp. SSG-1]|uniref:tetratricopeptide repeat protein n=1 Tax=Paenibacillus sp. SSG-1 TaxID=1443669 RepID=UPI000B7D2B11|nr:tetratricopeptide repeat protein [Paenibacillus sp. SSG-1]OXL81963.1 hypothetical protein BCV73_01920 [Paenibacillus sp. SSG-1]
MNIWERLGIERTTELRIIKKAYAAKLKQHHPEDDPEGYQQLREAYEAASKFAKEANTTVREPAEAEDELSMPIYPPEDTKGEVDQPGESNTHTVYSNGVFQSTASADPVRLWIHQAEELYDDFPARIRMESWERLLNEDIVWDVERGPELQHAFVSFLMSCRHLPRDVWQLLDGTFYFTEDPEELRERYPTYFAEYILQQLDGSRELRYDSLANAPVGDAADMERFLDLRESALDMLMEGDLEEAEACLSEASAWFADDLDLQLLWGKYNLAVGNRQEALKCFGHAILLQPDDLEAYRYAAQLRYDDQRYEEALSDCERILAAHPDDQDALSLEGRCLTAMGRISEAKERMKRSFDINNQHMSTLMYWSSTANKHHYDQGKIDPAEHRRLVKNNIIFDGFLFLRLTWLYIFVYIVLQLFFDVPVIVTGVFVAILLWYLYRTLRAHRVLST